jgi:hypothetical protein
MNRDIASAPEEIAVGEREDDAPVVRINRDDSMNRTALVCDPYARWCGRGEAVRLPPIPIMRLNRVCV